MPTATVGTLDPLLQLAAHHAIRTDHDAGPTADAAILAMYDRAPLIPIDCAGNACVKTRRRVAMAAGERDVAGIGSLDVKTVPRPRRLAQGAEQALA